MLNSSLPWTKEYHSLFSKKQLSHAYLISGRKGIGKKQLAEEISRKILCKEERFLDSCRCNSCKLFISSNHPDFHLIEREKEKKQIGINQIRDCFDALFESSFLNGNKIYLIYPAEAMNKDASNSALKILEEPPKNSLFILVSHRSQLLTPTILSRCSEIKVNTPKREQVKAWLKTEGIEDRDVELALNLSKNRPIEAAKLLSQSLNENRELFISNISDIIKKGENIILVSEEWSKDLESLPIKIEWMVDLLRDSLRHHFYQESCNTASDTDHISSYLGKKVNNQTLFQLLEETNKTWNGINDETNLRIDYLLKALFISWNIELAISS